MKTTIRSQQSREMNPKSDIGFTLIEISCIRWHVVRGRSAGFLLATCLALHCFGLASTCLAQPVPRISSGGGSALEGAQAVSVTVHRGENQTAAVSVDYSTKDGTAKAGVDYTS